MRTATTSTRRASGGTTSTCGSTLTCPRADVEALGIHVGDFVALHALPEITRTGYVKSRHLDDKAGVAAVLAALKAMVQGDVDLPVPTDVLITITEEVGHGASAGLDAGVAEMLSIDAAVVAPRQASTERTVTIAMQDMVSPFDYHFTRRLIRLAEATACPSGATCSSTTALTSPRPSRPGPRPVRRSSDPGVDATHGHERTHLDAIRATGQLVALYLQTELTFPSWDRRHRRPARGLPVTVGPARRTRSRVAELGRCDARRRGPAR
jgi:putative aminopeptidase FrvX